MNLSTLANGELVRHAYITIDPLTSSQLEQELLRRFEEQSIAIGYFEPIADHLAVFDLDKTKDVEACNAIFAFAEEHPVVPAGALLDVLTEFDIDDPAALKKALERNAKFETLLNDLADPIASLHSLITTPE